MNTATFTTTQTMLDKRIMDANRSVQEALREAGVHDYEAQEFGPEHKVILTISIVPKDAAVVESRLSLYRAKNRGDRRFWITALPEVSTAGQAWSLIVVDGNLSLHPVKGE